MAGPKRTSLHNRWRAFRARCQNPNNERFADYGGRGIRVCDAWRDFSAFEAWAKAAGYRPDLQIDRIDNDGPYSPENCRWVTPAENMRNQRVNRRYSIAGETLVLTDIAAKFGVTRQALTTRMDRGLSLDDAISEARAVFGPRGTTGVFHAFFGEALSYVEAERRFGIKWQTIRYRIAKGLSPNEAVSRPLRKAA